MINTIEENKISKQNNKLKLFIAYSHRDNVPDNPYIEEFKKHIAPLKNCFIEEWYDRLLLPGEMNFMETIDSNLETSDIICLFISANFLNSSACLNEKKRALKLKKQKHIPVIPIILSPCGWMEDGDLQQFLLIPTDAKPVSTFNDENLAWQDVYEGLKKIINKEINLRNLKITESFNNFLHDVDLFTKTHSKKEKVTLNDIYIETELRKIDNSSNDEDINSSELLDNLISEKHIIIVGEDQSGKTTHCKRLFCELRNLNYIPVYVSGDKISSSKKKIIEKSIQEQYINSHDIDIHSEKIVPIIDDFHHVIEKEKTIEELSKYPLSIVVIDEIFNININEKTLISAYTTFRIKELKPSIRYELVKKWVNLSDQDCDYKDVDKNVDLINSTLGRNIGKGLMPAYPFFILSTLFTYDTFIPLNQDITSQGHCYQAFIYYYLAKKRGVGFDEIEIYLNFLSEVASFMFISRKNELNTTEFSKFLKEYSTKYNLPIKQVTLLDNLVEIFSKDSFHNYLFKYPCFYYYFVAKALSDHAEEPKGNEIIIKILNNLQLDENAYIAVFLIHHSKKIAIFEELERVSSSLFINYTPATLNKYEMRFFDEQSHNIVKAVLPPQNVTPEMERNRRLKIEDRLEESHDLDEDQIDDGDVITCDLRKAIKTVEVMGCIIRNRAGSLERNKLQSIFVNAMNIHLRLISFLIEIIRKEDQQKIIVEYISKRISQLDNEKEPNQKMSETKKRRYAELIFWNINFFMIYAILNKIVHSLGSDKLTEISNYICDQVNSPSTFIIKHGILMGYEKNLQVEVLRKGLNDNDMSEISKRTATLMVVDYSAVNEISYRDKQRIEHRLKIKRCYIK